jgi:hypothetical protein
MTADEMKREFQSLYNMMASSTNVNFMHTFGQVHKEMMEWMIQNKPNEAKEWIEKLESIRWKNYLTRSEAENIVANMEPKAPWSREQWRNAMQQHGYDTDKQPYYNACALWVTMNMIMSDSKSTLEKYVESEYIFKLVYDLAVDKLTDKDKRFSIRRYFDL